MMRVANAEKTIQDYVAEFEIASFLNDDLLKHLQLFHFPAYSNIYIEQDEQHTLYFLVEGQVQCSHYLLNGKLAVFALSNPFAAIGDLEILGERKLYSNVIATKETVMLGIASDLVQRYGADDPRFLRFLIDQIREKLYQANFLQMSHTLPVNVRLAFYILSLATNTQENIIVLPGKEELASLLGTTQRHLNRVLKQLVESGAIRSGYPRVHILNREILEDLTL